MSGVFCAYSVGARGPLENFAGELHDRLLFFPDDLPQGQRALYVQIAGQAVGAEVNARLECRSVWLAQPCQSPATARPLRAAF